MSELRLEASYPQVWERKEDWEQIAAFSEDYKRFLGQCKTERETAREIIRLAQEAGFEDLDQLREQGRPLHPGDRLYVLRQNKAAALFVIGSDSLAQGMHLVCAHIDAPRLDIRPCPLYEKDDLALLKTHYYGGIKKYQWAAIPLALHGVICKKGGERVEVSIGEAETDPVFYISDLPKHLSAEQAKRAMADGISGEDLNLIVGSIATPEGETRRSILRLLWQHFGVTEKDLTSAELEVVPAGGARDAGLDGSMIVSYGQDDRVCAYTALRAVLETEHPRFTAGVLFADKEEIGSVGGSGMNSHLMENLSAQLISMMEAAPPLRLVLERSRMLSADVTFAMDPTYSGCYEERNTARLGRGPVITKYAGHMGKKGCNDANAEYLALLRDVFDEAGVYWQTGEFGRIDLGGGGTIAPFASAYGMQVVDCGVALLSMHAPYELSSKADVYEAYRAYGAFLRSGIDWKKYL